MSDRRRIRKTLFEQGLEEGGRGHPYSVSRINTEDKRQDYGLNWETREKPGDD
jgi:hypothetical protein